MINIYCITDINKQNYIGSTQLDIITRFLIHKRDKKTTKYCSSKLLDLENCNIKLLEICIEKDRKERERYWINNIECVNIYKLNGRDIENNNKWRNNNKDIITNYNIKHCKKYYNNNKDKLKEINRKHYNYKASWGGNERNNNNLLNIDLSIFQSP